MTKYRTLVKTRSGLVHVGIEEEFSEIELHVRRKEYGNVGNFTFISLVTIEGIEEFIHGDDISSVGIQKIG